MSPQSSNSAPAPKSPLLRRIDQAAVAALTLVAIGAIGMHWLWQGGATGRFIEIDRAPRQTANFTLDVNHADWPEISVLPGIGETLARRIVDSRAADGPFADLEQLRRVRGIGPKTLERIKPYLRPVPETGNVAGP